MYAVYNFFRQGWIAARIRDQLRTAFDGVDPVVIVTQPDSNLPPTTIVKIDKFDPGASTGFFAGSKEVVEPLRKAFERTGTNEKGEPVPIKYWYPWYTGVTKDTKARFATAPPAEPPPRARHPASKIRWKKDAEGRDTDDPEIDSTGHMISDEIPPMWIGLVPAQIEESNGTLRLATDDWPFLYTREALIPSANLEDRRPYAGPLGRVVVGVRRQKGARRGSRGQTRLRFDVAGIFPRRRVHAR